MDLTIFEILVVLNIEKHVKKIVFKCKYLDTGFIREKKICNNSELRFINI